MTASWLFLGPLLTGAFVGLFVAFLFVRDDPVLFFGLLSAGCRSFLSLLSPGCLLFGLFLAS